MNDKNIDVLANQPISKALLSLSLPATIAMAVNSLYNIIDTIFIGQYVGQLGIAGLSIAFPLQTIALGIGGMFGMGGASLISRQLGKNHKEKANTTLVTTIAFCLIVSLGYALVGTIFINPILRAFGASETIFPYAYAYMKIIFPGFVFFMMGICLNNIIRSEGAARTSMNGILIGAVGNIILDYLLISKLNMGIEGGAIATVISQVMAAIYLVMHYLRHKSIFSLSLRYLRFQMKLFWDIVSIGSSAFIVQAGNSILALILNNSLGYYGGDIMVSVYGVINKVSSFMVLPMIGIRQGAQPIIGYAYGAKNLARLHKAISTAIKIMIFYGLASFVILEVFAPQVFYLFASDNELVQAGTLPLRLVIVMIPLFPIAILTSSLFQSIGYARQALLTSLIKIIAVIPLVYLCAKLLGTMGIFISLPLADLVTIAISYALLKDILNRFKNLETI